MRALLILVLACAAGCAAQPQEPMSDPKQTLTLEQKERERMALQQRLSKTETDAITWKKRAQSLQGQVDQLQAELRKATHTATTARAQRARADAQRDHAWRQARTALEQRQRAVARLAQVELETLRHEREGLQRELEQLQELQSRQARAPLARAQ